MNKTIVRYQNLEFSFTDEDVIDIGDVSLDGDYNPYGERMWLIHDHGFTICVVMATNLQDALDAAVDENKMDRFLIDVTDPSVRDDYMTTDPAEIAAGYDPECPKFVDEDGTKYWWSREPAHLGNASEPFDIDTIGYVEFPLPKRSLTALYGHEVDAISCHCS